MRRRRGAEHRRGTAPGPSRSHEAPGPGHRLQSRGRAGDGGPRKRSEPGTSGGESRGPPEGPRILGAPCRTTRTGPREPPAQGGPWPPQWRKRTGAGSKAPGQAAVQYKRTCDPNQRGARVLVARRLCAGIAAASSAQLC